MKPTVEEAQATYSKMVVAYNKAETARHKAWVAFDEAQTALLDAAKKKRNNATDGTG